MFGRATIRLGIGPHSSSILLPTVIMYHAVQIHVVVDNCSLLRDQQRFLLLSKPVPCR